jgi:hypothetical protein
MRCLFDFPSWCSAWIFVLLRCLFDWIERSSSVNYWFTKWLSSSTMHIRRPKYSGYFDFIMLFIGMCILFYVINLNDVNLFTDSFFLFLAILNKRISFILIKKIYKLNTFFFDAFGYFHIIFSNYFNFYIFNYIKNFVKKKRV